MSRPLFHTQSIPADEIGVIGAGKKTIGTRSTVALIQSLYKCADDVYPNVGHLIVDECHRALFFAYKAPFEAI